MDAKTAEQEIELARRKFSPRALMTNYVFAPKKLTFWRDSFLIFWTFSLIGHFAEFAWRALPPEVNGILHATNEIPFFAVAAPYGFGALALIWTIFPLRKWLEKRSWMKNSENSAKISAKNSLKNYQISQISQFFAKIFPRKIGVGLTFFIGAVLATVIEFVSAALITLILGENPFWNYSADAFNLFGFVCLRNSLAFGAISVAVIFVFFPLLNNFLRDFLKRFPRILNAVFLVIFLSYAAIQVGRFF